MVLQGCSHDTAPIANGVLYRVVDLNLNERGEVQIARVRMLERCLSPRCGGYVVSLNVLGASRPLRLTHCVAYRSAQGCSIGDGARCCSLTPPTSI